ncbi:MAG: hypothetical protein JSU85_08580 [Candidatus Zixiibacteriota bacterium]|nr:MAG: hypothetical protein JSU85_08580 [candidate division Zixibacteria bacterium]
MKNLFLILLFVFFSSNSYAAVFDEKSTITEKAQDLVCDCEEGKDKITADTKLKNVEREELDL